MESFEVSFNKDDTLIKQNKALCNKIKDVHADKKIMAIVKEMPEDGSCFWKVYYNH